jgi:hypothetical protein
MVEPEAVPPPVNNMRLKLPSFRGTGDDGAGFLRRLELLADRYNWDEDEKVFQLGFNVCGTAGTWFSTLPEETSGTWETLKVAFNAKYVNSEPNLVLESRLAARRLLSTETVEDYLGEVLFLGSKLERSPGQLGSAFIQGLPVEMQNFCLSTDLHTLDSYSTRAKLFQARRGMGTGSVPQASPMPVATISVDEMKGEIMNHITSSLEKIRVKGNTGNRGRGTNRPGRGAYRSRRDSRDRDRNSGRDQNRDRDRNRSKSPARSKSPGFRGNSRDRDSNRSRKVRFQEGACFICGEMSHWAADCPDRFDKKSN